MKPLTPLTRNLLAAAIGIGALAFASTAATAYVACNAAGDCWHTDTRVHFPGVTLSFHNDSWADRHRHDKHYSWHENDNDHDWHHGYWDHGTWHSG